MIDRGYDTLDSRIKKRLENTCEIGIKLFYIFAQNYCLKRSYCKGCSFRNSYETCSLSGIPENWRYYINELKRFRHYIRTGYNITYCCLKYGNSKEDIVNYIGAISVICSTSVRDCNECKYRNIQDPIPAKCTLRYLRKSLKNGIY